MKEGRSHLRYLVYAFLLCGLVGHAFGQEVQDITVPQEFDQGLSQSMGRLLIAYRCDRWLHVPDMFDDATIALNNFYKRAGKPDADAVTNYVVAQMARVHQVERDPIKDKMYTPEMCAELAASLKREVSGN